MVELSYATVAADIKRSVPDFIPKEQLFLGNKVENIFHSIRNSLPSGHVKKPTKNSSGLAPKV